MGSAEIRFFRASGPGADSELRQLKFASAIFPTVEATLASQLMPVVAMCRRIAPARPLQERHRSLRTTPSWKALGVPVTLSRQANKEGDRERPPASSPQHTRPKMWTRQRWLQERVPVSRDRTRLQIWLRGLDLNQRPSGYETDFSNSSYVPNCFNMCI